MFVYIDFLVCSSSIRLFSFKKTSLVLTWTIVKSFLIFRSLEKLSVFRESLSLPDLQLVYNDSMTSSSYITTNFAMPFVYKPTLSLENT